MGLFCRGSELLGDTDSVYIFLKHREENLDKNGIVLFFKKGQISYGGDRLYWMQKVKILRDRIIILYQHKNHLPK